METQENAFENATKETRFLALTSLGFKTQIAKTFTDPDGRTHWKGRLYFKGKMIHEFDYSQGRAIKHAPSLVDVMYALSSDASCFEGSRNLDEFLHEFGYVETKNVSQGLKAYEACKDIAQKLTPMPEYHQVQEILEGY